MHTSLSRVQITPISRLMNEEAQTVTVFPDGSQLADAPVKGALLSGSFNPLHQGHVQLADVASAILGVPTYFELSIINADKGGQDVAELDRRLRQFQGHYTVVLSRAPLFREKSLLFPGCAFIIGYDTAIRLVAPRYYGGVEAMHAALESIRTNDVRFLVAGRLYQEQFHTFHNIPIAPAFRDMFIGLTTDQFRVDISSTELREQAVQQQC